MASLYKIKSLNIKFRDITVGHDLTKKQREECKALVAEAKRRSVRGTWYTKSGAFRGIESWCNTEEFSCDIINSEGK